MKLKVGNEVYLQKYEVVHLLHTPIGIPSSILEEIFGEGAGTVFIVNDLADSYKFGCVFRRPRNVKWLMTQDWILDYDEYNKKSLIELENTYERLKFEYTFDVDEFNAKDDEYRRSHFRDTQADFAKRSHKIDSLNKFIAFRKHEINFFLPEERKNLPTPSKKSGFFTKLFSRSAQ